MTANTSSSPDKDADVDRWLNIWGLVLAAGWAALLLG